MTIAERALDFVTEGSVIGLGSGRAATAFVRSLGERVRGGFRIRGVPTSQATAEVAREVGVPLTSLAEAATLDLTVDGADEVDPQLDLIKGYGGALVREKIVAASSRRLVILVGSEKLVDTLGQRGILPVEVVPYGVTLCRRRFAELGFESEIRNAGGRPFMTDNGNLILDCKIPLLDAPDQLESTLLHVPGVVGTGLFLGMADTVLVQDGEKITERRRP
jgi:ribose 5-phosphate isomerase A